MSKEETIKVLRDKGFSVELIDNAIMLMLPSDYNEAIIEEFKASLLELGYNASFGWHGMK